MNHGLGREARQFYQDVPGNLTIHATKGEWDEVANQNKSNKLIATLRRMVHRVAPNVEVVIATIAVLASLVTVFVAGARWYRTGKVLPAGRRPRDRAMTTLLFAAIATLLAGLWGLLVLAVGTVVASAWQHRQRRHLHRIR